jgi:hypothetical protein
MEVRQMVCLWKIFARFFWKKKIRENFRVEFDERSAAFQSARTVHIDDEDAT